MAERIVPLSIACMVALLSATGVVMAQKPVHCAFFLLLHSLSIAALYLGLAADFVAMGQVVVYSGAIVVLFLFVVLLLPSGGKEEHPGGRRILVAITGGGVMLMALVYPMVALLRHPGPTAPEPGGFSVAELARSLFGSQLVPFELTAILLLVAIIGGVGLWHRQGAEGRR